MNFSHRWLVTLAVVAAASASEPSTSSAQVAQPVPNPDPWRVAVTPTLNPLAVGLCAAVHLTVFEGTGLDVPRQPTGFRVTMADFDMAVTGASVVGWQIDPTHWRVCACQGGSAGTMATVTATYPAQALGAKARVPGVAFQRMATFALAMPKGTINPSVCLTAGASPTGAAAPAPATPVIRP